MFGRRASSRRLGSSSGQAGGKTEQETEPERILWLKKCTDMLLAGGYFRARISTLSPFDRIVGGLVWSITASNVDVDVDIIFEENSTIGQRIKLSDQIIRALLRLKCPVRLHPQEIQGLNYERLFPVIQWLVRKVIETRELMGEVVRAQAETQFSKTYKLPQDTLSDDALSYVDSVIDQYKPKRRFKRRSDAAFASIEARTEATLLEYGEKFYRATIEEGEDDDVKKQQSPSKKAGGAFASNRSAIMSKFEGKTAQQKKAEKKAEADKARKQAEEEERKRVEGIKSKLDAVDGSEGAKVAVKHIDSSKISDLERAFDEEMAKQAADEPVGRRGQEQSHKRRVDNLTRQLEKQREVLAAAKAEHDAVLEEAQNIKAQLNKTVAKAEQIREATEQLHAQEETHANKSMLPQLKAMVRLNEKLKRQENEFKQTCAAQRDEYQAMLKNIESEDGDDETQRMLEIERIYEADLAKLNRLRQVLAKKNQEIAKMRRAIDDIPTRAELIQYERRFVELYELVSEKLKETRKYYALYNTLEETHQYMTNEVSLLEDITKNFSRSMASKAGRGAFLESFRNILNNVDQNNDHVLKEQQSEEAMRDLLSQKYKKLLEKQRKYFKMVKEFQDECFKNEKLAARIEELGLGDD